MRDGETPAYKYHPNARIADEGRQQGFARRLETSPQAAARARRALKGSTTRDAVASFNVEAEQVGKTPMGAQNTRLLRDLGQADDAEAPQRGLGQHADRGVPPRPPVGRQKLPENQNRGREMGRVGEEEQSGSRARVLDILYMYGHLHEPINTLVKFFCTDTYFDWKSLRIQNRNDLTTNVSYV